MKNRPQSAFQRVNNNKQKLGSQCPVILKHEITDYQESEGQRNRQQTKTNMRPQTASIHFNKNMKVSNDKLEKIIGFESLENGRIRPSTAKNIENASKKDFIEKVVKNSYKNENNQIKAVRGIDTYKIHKILYNMKQSKEVLDSQIDYQEKRKRAIDYILKLNSKMNPNSVSNQYLMYEKDQRRLKKEQWKLQQQENNKMYSTTGHFNRTDNMSTMIGTSSMKRKNKLPQYFIESEDDNQQIEVLSNQAVVHQTNVNQTKQDIYQNHVKFVSMKYDNINKLLSEQNIQEVENDFQHQNQNMQYLNQKNNTNQSFKYQSKVNKFKSNKIIIQEETSTEQGVFSTRTDQKLIEQLKQQKMKQNYGFRKNMSSIKKPYSHQQRYYQSGDESYLKVKGNQVNTDQSLQSNLDLKVKKYKELKNANQSGEYYQTIYLQKNINGQNQQNNRPFSHKVNTKQQREMQKKIQERNKEIQVFQQQVIHELQINQFKINNRPMSAFPT